MMGAFKDNIPGTTLSIDNGTGRVCVSGCFYSDDWWSLTQAAVKWQRCASSVRLSSLQDTDPIYRRMGQHAAGYRYKVARDLSARAEYHWRNTSSILHT